MTVREAAKRLGVSSSKMYQLASARRIAFYRIDGKIVFAEADVEAFLQSCRVGAVAPVATAPRVRPTLKHIKLSPS